jgi:hypothetical protein
VAHERISADQRNMERFIPVDDLQNTVNEFLAFKVS